MKNANKLRITALALVFIVTAAACNAQSAGRTINSATALKEYLDSQPANTPDKPIRVSMGANGNMLKDIAKAIQGSGKYVYLTLTGSALTAIPDIAFIVDESKIKGCEMLIGVTIPSSVTSIGDGAFYGCKSLASVSIPTSVTSIGDVAFSRCTNLANITIPNSVTSIGDDAFYGCASLAGITVGNGNTNYASEGGILYDKAKTKIVHVPRGISGNVTIPDSVTSIGDDAFNDCTSLASVTIGNGVTSIGEYAFKWCTSLAGITVGNGNTNYASEGGILYDKAKTKIVHVPRISGNVTIPNGVTSIGGYAFQSRKSLASVTIPASVTSIGHGAFDGCTSLTSVTFQGTITSGKLGSSPFDGDLRAKYLAGGPGTYTRASGGNTWTKR